VGKATFTLKERADRERRIKGMVEAGLSQSDIAAELGITPQAVSKFMAIRGWKIKTGGDLPQH